MREVGGGVYRVALPSGDTVEASLRGRVKRQGRVGSQVVIGDEVELAGDPEVGYTIERVLERRTSIVRRGRGGRGAKIMAANVDRLVAVFAVKDPRPDLSRIDRLLVIAEADDIEPVLVFNKMDLLDDARDAGSARAEVERWAETYRTAGYRVLLVSALSGEGMPGLRAVLNEGVSALVGPSGVGKSSLLNAIEPSLGLKTGELSRKVARGRHTTVSARMIELGAGGLVADTPGFGDVGVWGVPAEELDMGFPEIRELRDGCRFHDCTHLVEPDCAVLEALEEGELPESRYRSYAELMAEAT